MMRDGRSRKEDVGVRSQIESSIESSVESSNEFVSKRE
jgi:hypothetical protein